MKLIYGPGCSCVAACDPERPASVWRAPPARSL